jgi:hypothetical protein
MPNNSSADGMLRVDALEAKAIYLIDSSGAARASLICASNNGEKHGHVVIHLYDREGRPRMSLQVDDEEGASVALFNQTNSPCISVGVFNNRGNGLTICDAEGKPMIDVGASGSEVSGAKESRAEISVLNSVGEQIWSAP